MAKKKVKKKSDTISIPKPRVNLWAVVSIILLVALLVVTFTGGGSDSERISKEEAKRILMNFIKSGGGSGEVESIQEVSGLYQVNLSVRGQILPIYITTDGKNLVPAIVSFEEIKRQQELQGGGNGPQPKDMSLIESSPALFPSVGPSDAKTVVVEFLDFQCPFCGLASGLIPDVGKFQGRYGDLIGLSEKLKKEAEKGNIRFIVATMSFLGPESVYAAEAGLCANKQGKFFEMHDAIFKAQTQGENTGKYNKDKLIEIAKTIPGLKQDRFANCLNNGEMKDNVQRIAEISKNFASGTPSFYVNGVQVSASWNEISARISS